MIDYNPLVSVIVPVYNTEKYLTECLDSIANQRYENIEVLMVDDGSTDNSRLICEEYVRIDRRFIYFYKENGGLSSARNLALDNLNGDFLMFVDSDDVIFENTIKKCLEEYEDGTDIVQFGYSCGHEFPGERRKFKNKKLVGEEITQNYMFYGPEVVWNKFYRKTIFDKIRFNEGIIHEDTFLMPQVMLSITKMKNINISLYFYRKRENSIMSSGFSNKKMDILKCTDNLIMLFSKTNLSYAAIYRGIITLINFYAQYADDEVFLKNYLEEVEDKILEYKSILRQVPKGRVRLSWKVQLFVYNLSKGFYYRSLKRVFRE